MKCLQYISYTKDHIVKWSFSQWHNLVGILFYNKIKYYFDSNDHKPSHPYILTSEALPLNQP